MREWLNGNLETIKLMTRFLNIYQNNAQTNFKNTIKCWAQQCKIHNLNYLIKSYHAKKKKYINPKQEKNQVLIMIELRNTNVKKMFYKYVPHI